MCKAVSVTIAKTNTVYDRVDVATGIKCTYVCRSPLQEYQCTSKVSNEVCSCEKAGPRLVVIPVASSGVLVGHDEEKILHEGCVGRTQGYQFPDPVPCVSMKGDVKKQRVQYTKVKKVRVQYTNESGRCKVRVVRKTEVRYAASKPNALNLEGCIYVCRQAGPRCTGRIEDGMCECSSPGLIKQLVPLDSMTLSSRMRQTNCKSGSCGRCGVCNRDTGHCELHRDMTSRKRCPCGAKCPSVEEAGARSNKGGRLDCEPNVKLECMKKPGWLEGVMKENVEAGTVWPNKCISGTNDQLDSCGCAEGYVEKPWSFFSVSCVRG